MKNSILIAAAAALALFVLPAASSAQCGPKPPTPPMEGVHNPVHGPSEASPGHDSRHHQARPDMRNPHRHDCPPPRGPKCDRHGCHIQCPPHHCRHHVSRRPAGHLTPPPSRRPAPIPGETAIDLSRRGLVLHISL